MTQTQNIPTDIDPYVVLYEDCDELIHTSEHPFCSDESCPCHEDDAAFDEQVAQPIMDGLLTVSEGYNLFWGEML
jgi:hypothetical protein